MHITQAITPLRMLFWGGLICIIDLNCTIQGGEIGLNIDLINDFVGMLFILMGIKQLADFPVSDSYQKTMRILFFFAVIYTFQTAMAHFVLAWSVSLQIAEMLFALATLVALIGFTHAMRQFALAYNWADSAESWSLSQRLVTYLGGAHLATQLLWLSALAWASAGGNQSSVGYSPRGFDLFGGLFVLVFLSALLSCVAMIHLLISLSRMQLAAEKAPPPQEAVVTAT